MASTNLAGVEAALEKVLHSLRCINVPLLALECVNSPIVWRILWRVANFIDGHYRGQPLLFPISHLSVFLSLTLFLTYQITLVHEASKRVNQSQ